MKPSRNKYHAKKTPVMIDGKEIVFDSKAEARRYGVLRLLEMAGEIVNLRLQVIYDLKINNMSVGKYIADFEYIDKLTGTLIVEDVKGFKTAVYRLKKRLMKAIYHIDVQEVSA